MRFLNEKAQQENNNILKIKLFTHLYALKQVILALIFPIYISSPRHLLKQPNFGFTLLLFEELRNFINIISLSSSKATAARYCDSFWFKAIIISSFV